VWGHSLLEVAVDRHPESIQLLLDGGADINERNDNGFTPLFLAKDPKTARLLLSLGADPHAQTNYGMKPIDYCRQHPEIRRILEGAMRKTTSL